MVSASRVRARRHCRNPGHGVRHASRRVGVGGPTATRSWTASPACSSRPSTRPCSRTGCGRCWRRPALLQAYGIAAADRARSRYALDRIGQETVAAYERCLRSRSAAVEATEDELTGSEAEVDLGQAAGRDARLRGQLRGQRVAAGSGRRPRLRRAACAASAWQAPRGACLTGACLGPAARGWADWRIEPRSRPGASSCENHRVEPSRSGWPTTRPCT